MNRCGELDLYIQTPILSFGLSTYWAGLDLAWILICNQYVVSCKQLPACILLGTELHLIAFQPHVHRCCWM